MEQAADPAIASAAIASELRRGADYVRVTVALTIVGTDVADALAIAWDAFRAATPDDLAGWEVAATVAQVDEVVEQLGLLPADYVLGVLGVPTAADRRRMASSVAHQLGTDGLTDVVGAAQPGTAAVGRSSGRTCSTAP